LKGWGNDGTITDHCAGRLLEEQSQMHNHRLGTQLCQTYPRQSVVLPGVASSSLS